MPSGRVFGKYDVLRRIAAGGMGEIYLGRQRGVAGIERLVILKTLLPQLTEDAESVAAFLDEARILGCINHPNVVAMLEVGEHNGEYVMAMEHVHGVDLSQLRKAGARDGKPLPPAVAAALIYQAALGLDAVHRAKDARGMPLKVVHRDVSPQNLMVRADGNVKLLDFGVARAEQKQAKTVHGQLKGKLGYMSPEQIRTQPLDGRHDEWSLGVLFWELLVGKRLFRADDMVAMMKKIVADEVPPPSAAEPSVPPLFDDIVLRMLDKDRERRFPTLNDVAVAIKQVLDAHRVPAGALSQYVERMVGPQLDHQMSTLLSEASEPIEAPPTTAQKTCERCSYRQPTTNRFCASCGASLDLSESVSVQGAPPPTSRSEGAPKQVFPVDPPEVGGPGAPGVSAPLAEGRGAHAAFQALPPDELSGIKQSSLFASARAAPQPDSPPAEESSLPQPRHAGPGCVVTVHVIPEDHEARCRPALKALAELHRSRLYSLPGGGLAAHFEDHPQGRAADRALAFGLAVSSALVAFNADAHVAVALGEAHASGDSLTGVAVEAARALLDVLEPRVIVDASARALLARNLKDGRLVSVDASYGASTAIEVVGGPSARPQPSVVGRDALLMQLADAVGAVRRGRGALFALSGGAGVGKSALLNEVTPLAAWKGLLVARASGSLKAAAPPLDVVRQLVRSCLIELASDVQFPAPGLVGLELGLDASGLSAGDQARLNALFSPSPRAEALPLAARASALRASIARLFLTTARRRGLVLLIDDADLMDAASRALLEALLPRLEGERAAVFVAFNPKGGTKPLPGSHALRVTPLEDHAIASMVEAACGPISEGVRAWLQDQGGGNPRAALAAMGLFASEGCITQTGGTWDVAPSGRRPKVDKALSSLLEALVRKLSPEARAALHGVAVAGGAVPDEPEVVAAYDEAAGLGLVSPRLNRPAPLSPTVQLALVQSAQRAGAQALHELHAAVAARAEARLAQDAAAADVCAWHRRHADPASGGVVEYVRALTRHGALGILEPLLETGAQLCAALARGALRPAGAPHVAAITDVVVLTVEALLTTDPAQALALADATASVLAPAGASAPLARLARVRAHALARVGRHAEVDAALASAASIADRGHAGAVAAVIAVDRARAAEARRDLEGARGAFADAAALPVSEGEGEERAAWTAATGLASVLAALGDLPEAMIAAERALERAHGQPLGEAAVEATLARIAPHGEPHARRAVAAADRAADITTQVFCRHVLAERLVKDGRVDTALEVLTEAVALARDALYAAGVDATRRALADAPAPPASG